MQCLAAYNRHANILIPEMKIDMPVTKSVSKEESVEILEDWKERVYELFEWVGMASLGSERFNSSRWTAKFF